MKKTLLSIILTAVLLAVLCVPALGETAEAPLNIIGKWRVYHTEEEIAEYRSMLINELDFTAEEADDLVTNVMESDVFFIFYEDGTMEYAIPDPESPIDNFYKYDLEGDLLTIHYVYDWSEYGLDMEEFDFVGQLTMEGDLLYMYDTSYDDADPTILQRVAE